MPIFSDAKLSLLPLASQAALKLQGHSVEISKAQQQFVSPQIEFVYSNNHRYLKTGGY